MQIINFEEAKARKQSKERITKQRVTKQLLGTDDDVLELQRQYQEYAQFCNRWYDEHVVGQDENGRWIYKY